MKAAWQTIQGKMRISYYIIIAAVSIVLLSTYFISQITIERNAVNSRMSALKLFTEDVNAEIEYIMNLSDLIYNSSSVNEYISQIQEAENEYEWYRYYTKLYRVMQDFKDTVKNSGRNYQILLYQKEEGVLYYSWELEKPDKKLVEKNIPDSEETGVKRSLALEKSYKISEDSSYFYFYNQYKGIGTKNEELCIIIGIQEEEFLRVTELLAEDGSQAALCTKENGIIFVSEKDAQETIRKFPKNFPEENSLVYYDKRAKRIHLLARMDAADGYLMLSVKRDSLVKGFDTWWIICILCMIVVLIAVFFVLHYLNRSILHPVKELHREMQKVKEGVKELERPERISKDEIGNLTNQFYDMVERIEVLEKETLLKEKQKYKLEIEALQAQINPHFLYNTINAVKMLLRMERKEDAQTALAALNDILKNTLSDSSKTVTLESEIQMLNSYIFIRKLRYDQFQFQIYVDKELLDCRILKFLIQPFIENCFLHGFEEITEETHIEVIIKEKNGDLEIWINDNGTGMDDRTIQELLSCRRKRRGINGIGVGNVIERVKKNYGSGYYVDIYSKLGEGTSVCLVLPIERR